MYLVEVLKLGTFEVFIFDNDCGFCTAYANFLLRIQKKQFKVVAYQDANLGQFGLTKEMCKTEAQWVLSPTEVWSGSEAISKSLIASGNLSWILVGHLISLPIIRKISKSTYKLIARNRHRIPMGTSRCKI